MNMLLVPFPRWPRRPLIAMTVLLAACAHQAVPPATHTLRPSRPAVSSDAQNRERARQALQRATVSSNEYSACMMFATSAHRNSGTAPQALADAAASSCAPKLDDYETAMVTYYELNPIRPVSATAPRERAHDDRNDLARRTREAVLQSLGQP